MIVLSAPDVAKQVLPRSTRNIVYSLSFGGLECGQIIEQEIFNTTHFVVYRRSCSHLTVNMDGFQNIGTTLSLKQVLKNTKNSSETNDNEIRPVKTRKHKPKWTPMPIPHSFDQMPSSILFHIFDLLSHPLSRSLTPFRGRDSTDPRNRAAGPRHADTAALAGTCRHLRDFYCQEYVNTLDLQMPSSAILMKVNGLHIARAFWRYSGVSCVIYPLHSKRFGVRIYPLPSFFSANCIRDRPVPLSPPARDVSAGHQSLTGKFECIKGSQSRNTTYAIMPLANVARQDVPSLRNLPLSANFESPFNPLLPIITQASIRSLHVDSILFTYKALSHLIASLTKLEEFSLLEKPEYVRTAPWDPSIAPGVKPPIDLKVDILERLPKYLKRLSLSSNVGTIFCPKTTSLRVLPDCFTALTELHVENVCFGEVNCEAIGKLSTLETLIVHGCGTEYTRNGKEEIEFRFVPFATAVSQLDRLKCLDLHQVGTTMLNTGEVASNFTRFLVDLPASIQSLAIAFEYTPENLLCLPLRPYCFPHLPLLTDVKIYEEGTNIKTWRKLLNASTRQAIERDFNFTVSIIDNFHL